MRYVFIWCFVSLVTGRKLIQIKPRNFPNLMVAVEDIPGGEGPGKVELVDSEKNRKKTTGSPTTRFSIDNGEITELVSQEGDFRLCKGEKTEDIEACRAEGANYSKWKLSSTDGNVIFKTEESSDAKGRRDICMQAVEDKLGSGDVRLVGRDCNVDNENQLFDVKFIDAETQDSDESEFDTNAQKDLPLGELFEFILKQPPGQPPAVSQRVILYDGSGHRMSSFRGAVNPLMMANLSSGGILPHSSSKPSTSPSTSPSPDFNVMRDDVTLAPTYANYGRY